MTPRTYGSLALADDRWIIADLEPHVRIRLKQIFPRVPRAASPPFVLPADPPTSADLHWFCDRYPLALAPDDRAALTQRRRAFDQRQREAERLLAVDYAPPPVAGLKPGRTLRQHQLAACSLLQLVKGLLVGDDVGEGKTFTAIGACLLPGALPATIVVDPHLQRQWAMRFADWTDLSVHCVNSTTPYPLPPADVRIFRWTQLLGWADVFDLLGSGLVAFDEMQELRHGTESGRGEAAMALVKTALYRLGLTATPIYGYGVEIHNVMSYLRPEVLGPKGDFIREWAPSWHVTDPKALGTYLREQHAFVRKRKASERVERLVQTVDYDAATLAEIDDIARDLAIKATRGAWSERGEATRELDLRVRMQTGIAKARAVAKVVRIIVEAGEPVLLVGWHRDVYDIWNEDLADLKPAMHTGSETPAQKAREVARFLNGDTDVFILSLRSGRGLDGLQARCRFAVIGELDWSPQVIDQVIGRLDREGSVIDGTEQRITALILVAEDGSDPPMMELLGLKASESSAIVDPDLGVRQVSRDGSHLKALVDHYLGKGASGARIIPIHAKGPPDA